MVGQPTISWLTSGWSTIHSHSRDVRSAYILKSVDDPNLKQAYLNQLPKPFGKREAFVVIPWNYRLPLFQNTFRHTLGLG